MIHFPACLVVMPADTKPRRAAFYLAAEEWVAGNLPFTKSRTEKEVSYLFTWQVQPTVVMGRNQIAHQEVDIDFCKRNGIDIIRRKSGGGAIFADEGNIMISLITSAGKVEPLFEEYAETVAEGLRSLGADVKVSGRNDIVLIERADVHDTITSGKICGNSFYHLADRNIVHGTMLFTTNPKLMAGALKPMPQKLRAKGVQSVRSRIGLLSNANLSLPDEGGVSSLRKEVEKILSDRFIRLDNKSIQEIERIEQGYYDQYYLYGSCAKDEVIRGARIEGCGVIEFHFVLKGSMIKKVNLSGDYFELYDAQQEFSKALEGVTFTDDNIAKAIICHHPEASIRNLSINDLIEIIKI